MPRSIVRRCAAFAFPVDAAFAGLGRPLKTRGGQGRLSFLPGAGVRSKRRVQSESPGKADVCWRTLARRQRASAHQGVSAAEGAMRPHPRPCTLLPPTSAGWKFARECWSGWPAARATRRHGQFTRPSTKLCLSGLAFPESPLPSSAHFRRAFLFELPLSCHSPRIRSVESGAYRSCCWLCDGYV